MLEVVFADRRQVRLVGTARRRPNDAAVAGLLASKLALLVRVQSASDGEDVRVGLRLDGGDLPLPLAYLDGVLVGVVGIGVSPIGWHRDRGWEHAIMHVLARTYSWLPLARSLRAGALYPDPCPIPSRDSFSALFFLGAGGDQYIYECKVARRQSGARVDAFSPRDGVRRIVIKVARRQSIKCTCRRFFVRDGVRRISTMAGRRSAAA